VVGAIKSRGCGLVEFKVAVKRGLGGGEMGMRMVGGVVFLKAVRGGRQNQAWEGGLLKISAEEMGE